MITELREAIESEDNTVVTDILSKLSKEDLRQEDLEGLTALALASRLDKSQCVKVLLRDRADGKNDTYTPKHLYQALIEAAENNSATAMSVLISAGVDVNLNYDYQTGTALHAAVDTESVQCVRVLLAAEADVEALQMELLQTPLMRAAVSGNVEVVKLMLDAGANINRDTFNSSTPLIMACSQGNQQVANLLLDRGANPHPKNVWGFTALYMGGDCFPLLCRLLQEGVDVNAGNGEREETVLHLACVLGSLDTVKALLDAGAHIDQPTVFNETALWLAVWKNHYDVTKFLLQHNCELDSPSNACAVWAWDYQPIEVALGTAFWDIAMMLMEVGCSWINKIYFGPDDQGPLPEVPFLRLRKEVLLLAQINPPIWTFLIEFCNSPRKLKSACRLKIRSILGPSVKKAIPLLSLPKVLCGYLNLDDF